MFSRMIPDPRCRTRCRVGSSRVAKASKRAVVNGGSKSSGPTRSSTARSTWSIARDAACSSITAVNRESTTHTSRLATATPTDTPAATRCRTLIWLAIRPPRPRELAWPWWPGLQQNESFREWPRHLYITVGDAWPYACARRSPRYVVALAVFYGGADWRVPDLIVAWRTLYVSVAGEEFDELLVPPSDAGWTTTCRPRSSKSWRRPSRANRRATRHKAVAARYIRNAKTDIRLRSVP